MNSVGSEGDSYDNALAETIIGLYETEPIRRRGPWKGLVDVEHATLEWVDWPTSVGFSSRSVTFPSGVESAYRSKEGSDESARLRDPSLRLNPARFTLPLVVDPCNAELSAEVDERPTLARMKVTAPPDLVEPLERDRNDRPSAADPSDARLTCTTSRLA